MGGIKEWLVLVENEGLLSHCHLQVTLHVQSLFSYKHIAKFGNIFFFFFFFFLASVLMILCAV